ncbi:ICAL protein, partial [Jacana jacana]|nr:ICAL protein [Jacana jacana]
AMDDLALDSLIDTLGGTEEDVLPSPAYIGPEIMEDISARYLEEMGKWEGSLPPEYVKLLKSKGDGRCGAPTRTDERIEKLLTEDELAEALAIDFTCAAASHTEKQACPAERPSKEGDIMQAQEVNPIQIFFPQKEKKTELEEEIKEDVLEALLDTLVGPELEPEKDLAPLIEVSELKAKEKREEKAGERDDTIPPEYRLTPELDKDGKPILPKLEEKPKPLSESDLAEAFSKDFALLAQPMMAGSLVIVFFQKPSVLESVQAAAEEAVPQVAACTMQSVAHPAVSWVSADEALEALSRSLGKRKPDPEEEKPVVDKVKEKAKQEEGKKLGEDEETIPPEYRLPGAKDKDGQPLLPNPEEKSQPMSENDLLEALAEGFSRSPSPSPCPPAPMPTPEKNMEGGNPDDSLDVISAAMVSAVQSSAPPATASGGKEMDEALDLLSDSLGQREPDPDENKPVEDKVKEKAESEHRDKLGERDDTIPPDYLKLLESGEQGKSGKPTAKGDVKLQEPKKPREDSAAIDALSSDFGTCAPPPTAPQHPKDKSGKETVTTKPAPREKGEPKDCKK